MASTRRKEEKYRDEFDAVCREIAGEHREWMEYKQQQFERLMAGEATDGIQKPATLLKELHAENRALRKRMDAEIEKICRVFGVDESCDLAAMTRVWRQLARLGIPFRRWPMNMKLDPAAQLAAMRPLLEPTGMTPPIPGLTGGLIFPGAFEPKPSAPPRSPRTSRQKRKPRD